MKIELNFHGTGLFTYCGINAMELEKFRVGELLLMNRIICNVRKYNEYEQRNP